MQPCSHKWLVISEHREGWSCCPALHVSEGCRRKHPSPFVLRAGWVKWITLCFPMCKKVFVSVCQWLQPWFVPSPQEDCLFPAVASYAPIPTHFQRWNVLLPASLSALFLVFVCGCGSFSLICFLRERHWQFIYVLREDYAHTQQASAALCLLRQK